MNLNILLLNFIFKKMKSKPTLILASQSPRRIELLKKCGLKFLTVNPKLIENVKKNENIIEMVKRLSVEKAKRAFKDLDTNKNVIILSADTSVLSPLGLILGKPRNTKEAFKMLKGLSGKKHQVYTGYSLLVCNKRKIIKNFNRVVKTTVKIKKINSREIINYIATKEPMDKAGAYAAQGIGMRYIESINGSYSNVVGLPLAEVIDDLFKKCKYVI